jgi:hypothetical protein
VQTFEVEMPGGGLARLKSPDEVKLFTESKEKYIEDYQLTKLNDLVLLGALLFQQVLMYRAQQMLSGMKEQRDASGVPTGTWIEADPEEITAAAAMMQKATDQIKGLEKALGIDKVTRESGGQYNLADYIRTLKKAAHERGIHISKRVLKIERFYNELAWRIRALNTWDQEDLAHHNLTPDTVIQWCDQEVGEIKEADKKFAKEVGKLFVGRL